MAEENIQFGGISGTISSWFFNKIINAIHIHADPAVLKNFVIDVGSFVKGVLDKSDPAAKSIIDAMVDNAVKQVNTMIDGWLSPTPSPNKSPGALVFGASDMSAQAPLTAQDVTDYMDSLVDGEKKAGNASPMFSTGSVSKLMANPNAVRAMKRLPHRIQLRAMADETVMDKILAFLQKWGLIALQIISVLVPILLAL